MSAAGEPWPPVQSREPIQPGVHVPVLLEEAVQALQLRPDGRYVDGTFGRGGHARAILDGLGPQGRLVVLDRDPQAVAVAHAIGDARLEVCHASFADLPAVLDGLGLPAVDGVLLDLGVSSPQLDEPARGFSFRHDAPLDMRMDTTRGITAAEFLAQAEQGEIERVVREYGEERFARAIAKAVVARRAEGRPLLRTRELAEVAARAVRTREAGQDPATRTFQALRIHVNGELDALVRGLAGAVERLAPGGRLAVISFHSLEDRLVKQFLVRESREVVDRRAPFAPAPALRLRTIARVRPSAQEVAANPRARSAILRVAERTGEGAA
ncbi:MAG: 16S rRNA (cytosine(1402)-N(4))-methyltransferase RsmH [Rubrivivax sp.]